MASKMRTFKIYTGLALLLGIMLIQSCNPPWEDHYTSQEDQINMKVWDAVKENPDYSTFVSLIETEGLDSLFQAERVYTLFVPTNEAFSALSDTTTMMQTLLRYHIIQSIFMDKSVQNWRRMLTSSGKFALIERVAEGYTFDGSPMEYASPLYLDGKYYEISQVAVPKRNLYEFTAQNSYVLKEYIDSKDSIFLDRSLSTPIGFDDLGNTVYDSVFGMVNLFEDEFFPISKEFRDKNATFILFTQEQYDLALDDMAARLGGSITDHEDIPATWQNNVFLPTVTENAMFDGILSYEKLEAGRVKNIKGDTVVVEAEKIDPDSRTICSNGVGFLYRDFTIHDTLFRGSVVREGEDMISEIGAGKYAWKEDVRVWGAVIEPERLEAEVASGGALVNLTFVRDYAGEYNVEYTFTDLFPMRYRLEWRANSRPSGLFSVYVNGQVLEYQDKWGNVYTEFDTNDLKQSVVSVTGERFLAEGGFNMRDYWVDHITEYGDVTIRFEYKGPGANSTNGFNIDYVKLIPDY
ncbi:MAG: fasciclin domain-containing protein [Bacteroidetes bacterium]|nr:fasciclin domain-containing protein [Bacteroidota bacterium]